MNRKKDIIFERIEQDKSLKKDIEFCKRISKIFELFGEDEGLKALNNEYKETGNFEQQYTTLRWTVYIALTTASFAISGYVLSTLNSLDIPVRIIALFFSWFIQFFATFFYWWFHNLGHNLRRYMQQLESILGFYRYTLRSKRPVPPLRIFKAQIQFKFHWVIYAITVSYLLGIILFAVKIKCFTI